MNSKKNRSALSFREYSLDIRPDYYSLINESQRKIEEMDFSGAKKILKKAIKMAPSDSKGYTLLAHIYNRSGMDEEAFRLYEQGVEKAASVALSIGTCCDDKYPFATARHV